MTNFEKAFDCAAGTIDLLIDLLVITIKSLKRAKWEKHLRMHMKVQVFDSLGTNFITSFVQAFKLVRQTKGINLCASMCQLHLFMRFLAVFALDTPTSIR